MKRTTARLLLPFLFLVGAAGSGCSTSRFSRHGDCALIGGGVGTAVGLGITIADDQDSGTVVAGGAVGAAVGALAGYGFCVLTD